MGRVYLPKLNSGEVGKVYMADFYVNGKRVRESTGCEREQDAKKFLKSRGGRRDVGLPVLPRADRVRYDEAARDLREHYQTTGCRNLVESEKRLKHLDRFFGGRRVIEIDPPAATSYVASRQAAGAANGTINRELSMLGRMLKLAYENNKLTRLPVIRKLREAAPARGSLSWISSKRCAVTWPPTFRRWSPSTTSSGGAHSLRC